MPYSGGVIGCHSNGATVNHLTRGSLAVLLKLFTGLPLIAFGTSTVEVLTHAVARGLVLTGVGITSI